jgi:hypothetical protein
MELKKVYGVMLEEKGAGLSRAKGLKVRIRSGIRK